MIRERRASVANGGVMVLVHLLLLGLVVYRFHGAIVAGNTSQVLWTLLLLAFTLIGVFGLFVVNPGEAVVLQLFGGYVGTAKDPGLWWTNPLAAPRRRVSLRVRNFESAKLKVNDHTGNPIEIAAVVVWQVIETAEALFQVDDYNNFVKVQTEAALRNLATSYPYDAHADGEIALRSTTGEVADRLKHEIQERLARAGVQVVEARISHLAYAPEIASVMLQRQQAGAIVAARATIVEGAVGMVEMALEKLNARNVVTLDEERKAAMVSNLLVVLCSEHETQPIVNAGTLY
jgi:regulator of protease activity HflC (stomatin/prohibitin superfamily)